MTYGAPATGELKAGRHAWSLNEEESQPFLRQALDLGINFFDTANVYSQRRQRGRFWGASSSATPAAKSVVVATKVHGVMRDEPNGRGLSRKAIFHELDESLRRLETDYVDLYQIHRWDYETPIEETLEALHDVVKSGQGALPRRLLHVRLAVRQGALSRRICTAGRVSSPCRTTTTCCIAKKSAR